jgi:hypothetical protein
MTRLLHCFVTAVVSVGIAGAARVSSAQDEATEQFIQRVNAYMEFRSDFTEMVPPLEAGSDPEAIETASNALAGALRAARPQARIGDVFAPDIVVAFRQRIDEAIRQQGGAAEDLLAEMASEAALFHPPLAVNARFEWSCSAAMPGFLIAALPPLPDELQYRFVGVDLVLVDVPARLVVDIMPLAIAIN